MFERGNDENAKENEASTVNTGTGVDEKSSDAATVDGASNISAGGASKDTVQSKHWNNFFVNYDYDFGLRHGFW